MLIDVDTVKGFQDFLPPHSLKRKAVRQVIEEHFRRYGFLPVETPIIELDELMRPDTLQIEDEAVSDRFRLKDRGGRNLGLRYEFTFQLARIFKQHPNIKLPFRLYQIGENFRDEPVGHGRFRQFTQCDADIVGDSSIDGEAELLSMINDILHELKIDAEIYVNNRKLINALIESVQIKETSAVMRELDKLDKLGEDLVKSNLRKYADTNQILTLFKLLEKDLAFFTSNGFDGAPEVEELVKKCRRYGVNVILQSTMMRGLSYYTGNVYEVRKEGDKNTIAGGGRYDKVVGRYLQREIPSFGISIGLERATELANVVAPDPVRAVLISSNKEIQTIKLMQELRSASIACVIFRGKTDVGIEYAGSLGIPYVVFISEEESPKKKFKLRNMRIGEERYLSEKQLFTELQKI